MRRVQDEPPLVFLDRAFTSATRFLRSPGTADATIRAMRRLLPFLSAALLATACQATGMGWMPSSTDPTEKATFGFVYDGATQTLSGSYIDHAGGVSLKGTGIMRPAPPPVGMNVKGGCILGEPMYESRERTNAGTGLLTLIVCDAEGGDFVGIIVTSGPFMGYQNSGSPSGNTTVTQP
jgi:hypothetical protein